MKGLLEYAEDLERLGQAEAALVEYADLVDANLCGAEPLLRRANLLRELGRPLEAQQDLELAAEVESHNGWPFLRLAQMAHSMGKPWLAAAYVQAALERQPDAPEIRINAAAIFTSLDWLDRAFAAVRPLPQDMSDWWGDMRSEGEAAYRSLHAQTLAELRRRRRTVGPDTAWEWVVSALFKLGKLRMARRLCENQMRDDPLSFAAFEVYARMVARAEGPSGAVGFLKAIVFLHRETSEYAEALRWMTDQMVF